MKSGEVKLFIGICVVALLLVGVAVLPMIMAKEPPGHIEPGPTPIKRDTIVPAWSPVNGNPKAPYTLVEFGDYQCESCAFGELSVKSLMKKHKDKLNQVFHHVTITPSHQWSPILARAAEAAALQGKYWPYHEELFINQARFKNAQEDRVNQILMDIAKRLKLDLIKFQVDLTKPEMGKRVDQMEALSRELKVDQTPTYYLVKPSGEVMIIGATSELEAYMAKPEALL